VVSLNLAHPVHQEDLVHSYQRFNNTSVISSANCSYILCCVQDSSVRSYSFFRVLNWNSSFVSYHIPHCQCKQNNRLYRLQVHMEQHAVQ